MFNPAARQHIFCPSLLVTLVLVFAGAGADAQGRPRVAIIIDDLGYKYALGQRAIGLPGPVTVAVLPGTPRGRTLAQAANDNGKEVMLHLPLQAIVADGKEEPGGIRLEMSRGQFATAFAESYESVPHIAGINTHRGSLLTRHPGHMAWLMEEIGEHDHLFFVDSFTTHESVALRIAREAGIPSLRRDVFLDAEDNEEAILREFERLKIIAAKTGAAIGIGHPFESTMSVLERELPKLEREGFELVSVSGLISARTSAAGSIVR